MMISCSSPITPKSFNEEIANNLSDIDENPVDKINFITNNEDSIELSIHEKALSTTKTFGELISEKKNLQLPFFIIVIKPKNSKFKPLFDDAIKFIKKFYIKNRLSYNNQAITSFDIFKSSKTYTKFKLFCNQSSLLINNEHYLKLIFACDKDLEPISRGFWRLHFASDYKVQADLPNTTIDKKIKYLTKQQLWLEKAAEDKCVFAYTNLVQFYISNNELVQHMPNKGRDEALKYLRLTMQEVGHTNKSLYINEGLGFRILKGCKEILQVFFPDYKEDLDSIDLLINNLPS